MKVFDAAALRSRPPARPSKRRAQPVATAPASATAKPAKRRDLKLTAPEPTEKQIQDSIIAALRLRGYLVVRINANSVKRGDLFMRSYIVYGVPRGGFPDLLALKDGRAVLLEVKTAKGKLRPSQEAFAAFAGAHGVAVHVVRSAGEALAAIEAAAIKGD